MKRNRPPFHDPPESLPHNLSYVLNLSPSVMTLGLGNMRRLLDHLDHPERRYRSVIVAGTNGKGSVTALLSSILRTNGLRVGRYNSPHVYSVTERISVDDEPVSIDAMEAAAAKIVPLHNVVGYSYFEALTALAFIEFANREVDVAVLETGLGGRFDATNVVDPAVCILTAVSLDHRELLGDSEEEILREKLGISRTGVPLLVGAMSPELLSIVSEKTTRESIPLRTPEDLGFAAVEELTFQGVNLRLRTEARDYGSIRVPFAGRHQGGNALLAVGAAELLLERVDDLAGAVAAAHLPGRFEAVELQGKTFVLDVAHNDRALIVTAETLAELSPRDRNTIVLGMLRRKELIDFPRHLAKWAKRVYLVEPAAKDAASSAALLAKIGIENVVSKAIDLCVWRRCETDGHWDRFIDHIMEMSGPSETILVTGSHRTIETVGRRLAARALVC